MSAMLFKIKGSSERLDTTMTRSLPDEMSKDLSIKENSAWQERSSPSTSKKPKEKRATIPMICVSMGMEDQQRFWTDESSRRWNALIIFSEWMNLFFFDKGEKFNDRMSVNGEDLWTDHRSWSDKIIVPSIIIGDQFNHWSLTHTNWKRSLRLLLLLWGVALQLIVVFELREERDEMKWSIPINVPVHGWQGELAKSIVFFSWVERNVSSKAPMESQSTDRQRNRCKGEGKSESKLSWIGMFLVVSRLRVDENWEFSL